jgi:membrane protein implicated in regulation of membrane protease activity
MFTLSAFREPDIRRRSNTLTLSFFAWSIVILLILLIFAALVGREYRRRRSRREPTEPPTAITISAPAKADRVLVDQMEDEGSDSVEWYS